MNNQEMTFNNLRFGLFLWFLAVCTFVTYLENHQKKCMEEAEGMLLGIQVEASLFTKFTWKKQADLR